MSVASFLEEFTDWVVTRTDVVAAGLVGSHARGAAGAASDVDLVILSTRAAALLKDNWPSLFGDVASRRIEDYGALQSVRVLYRHGLEVEFGIAEPTWAEVPLDPGTRAVLAGGAIVLYDPRGLLEGAKLAAAA